MAKRQAEFQITKDGGEDDEDDVMVSGLFQKTRLRCLTVIIEQNTPTFSSNPEEASKRVYVVVSSL